MSELKAAAAAAVRWPHDIIIDEKRREKGYLEPPLPAAAVIGDASYKSPLVASSSSSSSPLSLILRDEKWATLTFSSWAFCGVLVFSLRGRAFDLCDYIMECERWNIIIQGWLCDGIRGNSCSELQASTIIIYCAAGTLRLAIDSIAEVERLVDASMCKIEFSDETWVCERPILCLCQSGITSFWDIIDD